MSRFKTMRYPSLSEAEKQQILSRLIGLKDYLNHCSTHLQIGCDDYRLIDKLGQSIMETGETIAASRYWLQDGRKNAQD